MPESESTVCGEFEDALLDYCDGELRGAPRARLLAHLRDCPACAIRLAEHESVMDQLRRQVAAIRMPEAARERVWALLADEAARMDTSRRTPSESRPVS